MKKLNKVQIGKNLFYIILALCLTPLMSAPLALLTGILFATLRTGTPLGIDTGRVTKYFLQIAVVLIGFSMDLSQVIQTSKTGFWITITSVTFTMTIGITLAWIFKVEKKTGLLIACGTAICGGSAIAAVAPLIAANKNQISFSLAIVFALNAIALLIFPIIGAKLNLTQETFGYWAAIAIHDTSAVVGAGSAYGDQALKIATTVKLTRALWIIPLSILIYTLAKKEGDAGIKIPWFIGLFVVAILFRHFIPGWEVSFAHFSWLGQRGLVIALFLIGSSISVKEIKKAGWSPFLLGLSLWIIVSISSLLILTL
jgi:uncharacterized integral membrane protein (TIGR00698 family)